MKPEPKLEPCPYGCVGEVSVPEVDRSSFRGHCHVCGALGPTGYTREQGAQFWNTRPAPDAKAARREALEEAAELAQKLGDREYDKIADGRPGDFEVHWRKTVFAREIASVIRALALSPSQPKTEKTT